jgi:hypothetical protein
MDTIVEERPFKGRVRVELDGGLQALLTRSSLPA